MKEITTDFERLSDYHKKLVREEIERSGIAYLLRKKDGYQFLPNQDVWVFRGFSKWITDKRNSPRLEDRRSNKVTILSKISVLIFILLVDLLSIILIIYLISKFIS